MKRREVLKAGLTGVSALLVPQGLFAQLRPRLNEEHFFLQVVLQGGADFTYLFDARPLAMTAAGKIQNYIGEDPLSYAGINGGATLRTKLTDPLMPFKSYFSVVNGVMMAPTFEGHTQNMNLFFTGNPFGGESFLPHLNWESATASPLDGAINGYAYASVNNHGRVVPLEAQSVGALTQKLNQLPVLTAQDELAVHLRSRLEVNGRGAGRFSGGSRQMLTAFDGVAGLHGKLNNVRTPDSGADPETQYVDFMSQLFKGNIARSAIWVVNENFDTHNGASARNQPNTFGNVVALLTKIFSLLSNTPFDQKRSILDVTTVLVNSEFGRTMRIEGARIDETGTNHNSLCNSVLIGGKGIRGGQVIGASDFASPTEVLSGAHLQVEPNALSLMARPFDFSTGRSRTDLPATFNVDDYLHIGSVVNTIYQSFGVDRGRWRINARGGPTAPVIPGLLV